MPIDPIYGGYQPTTPYGHDASSRKNLAGADPYGVPDMNTPKPKYAKYSAQSSSSGSKKPDQPLLLAGLPSKPLSADDVDSVLGQGSSATSYSASSSATPQNQTAYSPAQLKAVVALAHKKTTAEILAGYRMSGLDLAARYAVDPEAGGSASKYAIRHGHSGGGVTANRKDGKYTAMGLNGLEKNYGTTEWEKAFGNQGNG